MQLNIIVLLKHIFDENQIKVNQETGEISFQGVPGKISTFDRNSLEAALRLKQRFGGVVTTLTVGPAEAEKSIREGLAMGADKAVLVKVDNLHAISANRLAGIIIDHLRNLQPWDLVITSEGGADTYTSVIPSLISQKLNLPLLSYLKSIEVKEDGSIIGERSLEKGVVTVSSKIPAVISVVSEINEPRIPTLLQIMASARKELKVYEYRDEERDKYFEILSMSAKSKERKKIIFEGNVQEAVSKLIDSLMKEGVLP